MILEAGSSARKIPMLQLTNVVLTRSLDQTPCRLQGNAPLHGRSRQQFFASNEVGLPELQSQDANAMQGH